MDVFNLDVQGPGMNQETLIEKYDNGIYALKIKIETSGNFTVSSQSLDKTTTINIEVLSGTPSAMSKCETSYKSSPTLRDGVDITYVCSLVDNWNIPIKPTQGETEFGLSYKCSVIRNDNERIELNVTIDDTTFNCTYTTSINGNFKFEAFWEVDSNSTSLNSVIPRFKVVPEPKSILNANVYDFNSNKWYRISDVINEDYYFNVIKTTEDGAIIAIDFLDVDGTSFSDIGYDHYDPKKLNGNVSSVHLPLHNEANTIHNLVEFNGKKVIKVTVNDFDVVFTLNSFHYEMILTYRDDIVTLKYKTPLDKAGSYQVCHHPLSHSHTQLLLHSNEQISSKVDSLISIGSIVLKTECDYLHNYFLADNVYDSFKFEIEPYNDNTEIFIERNTSITGVYDITMKSTNASEYNVYVKFDNTNIKDNHFACVIHPLEIAAIIDADNMNPYTNIDTTEHIYELERVFTADETPRIYFIAKDKFGNQLSYEPTSSNQNLHLAVTFTIDNVIDTSSVNLIKYDKVNNSYYIEDNSKKAGKYVITLTATITDNEVKFKYTKHPGKVSVTHSIVTVTNTKQMKSNSTSKVTVDLLDEYDNNIVLVGELLEDELLKLRVNAYSNSNDTLVINYTCNKHENLSSVECVSDGIVDVNTYIVQGKHNDQEIITCNSCMFDVVYSLFDTKMSVVKAIVKSSVITMSTGSALRVIVDDFIEQTPPMFQLELRTTSGELVDNVDTFINITFALENNVTNEHTTLRPEWVTNNIKLYLFDENEPQITLNGVYDLNVYYNEEIEKSFKVIFITDGIDYDDVNALNESTLFISNEEIYVTAGDAYQFTIEFRTEDDYRYITDDIAIENISLTPSIEDKGFSVSFSHGALQGQVIVDVILTKSTTFESPNVLSITYGGIRFNNTIKAIVTNGELYSLHLTSEDIDDTSTTSQTVELKAITAEEVKKVVFVPYDKYANIKRDLFNDVELMQTHIKQVISLTHTDTNSPLSYNVTYNITSYEIILYIQSLHIGKIYLYSQYFNNILAFTYTIPVLPGQLSFKSIAFINKDNTNINAGNTIELHLYTKDSYGNRISDITLDTVQAEFEIQIALLNDVTTKARYEIGSLVFNEDHFVYEITLFTKGKNVINMFHHNESIDVKYNIINVNCDVQSGINITKSVIIYDGTVYNNSQTVQFNKALLPVMYMQFYDEYGNEYELETMFEKVDVVFNGIPNAFCATQYNSQIMFSLCDITLWKTITSSPLENVELSFKFYTHNTDTDPQYTITYNVSVDNKEDTNISNESDIDVSKTIIKESTITLTAGVKYQLSFETRTSDNKRPNAFISDDELNKRMLVSFTVNNDAFVTSITPGLHYGEYIITIYTEKSCTDEEDNYLTLSIDGVLLDKYKVRVVVKPNNAVKGYFVNSLGEQLTSLENAKCDDVYALRAILLDKYNNKATDITNADFNYKVSHYKLPYTIDSYIKMNDDSSFTFELYPIYAGNYQIDSPYWNEGEYVFTANAGEIDAMNSYIGSDSPYAIAGETKKVYIVPYDKHGNYISPSTVNEFIMYRHVFINGEYSVIKGGNVEAINIINSEGHSESINAIVYDVVFTVSGDNIMSGVYRDKNLKCVQCVVNVSSANVSLIHSTLFKYSVDANAFVEMNGAVKEIEYNDKTLPLFRLYPKDQYGNVISYISEAQANEINGSIMDEDGSVPCMFDVTVNENNTCYDITLNDNYVSTYQELEYGVYFLKLSDSLSNEIEFEIIFKGNAIEEKTSEPKAEHTYVLYKDLTFVAGDGGYLILQLRDEKHLPYVSTDPSQNIPEISITTCNSDSSFIFDYTKLSPSTSSIIYIKVNSTYANTYPIYTACPLTLTVNSKAPSSSNDALLMKVSPSILNRAYVLPEYLESKDTLHPTNADVDLVFKLNVVDKFNNTAKASPSDVKLTIRSSTTSQAISSSLITASTEVNTGYIKYSVPLYKEDDYLLSAGSNANGETLFINDYTVHNSHGDIDMNKSSILIKNKVLEAGKSALMVITPFDKNSNAIPPEEISHSINVNIIPSSNGKVVSTTHQISSDARAIEFIGVLIHKGDNVWHVYLNETEVNCYGCITDVYPTKCDASQTLVYFLNENQKYEQAGDSTTTKLYSHVDNPLSIYLSFRDVYGNDIDSVDSTISVHNAIMSGNYMDDIEFETKRSTDMTKYRIELPSDDTTVYRFTHLVQRDLYKFTFNVKVNDDNEAEYKYNVSHYTNINDTLYGNGIYKCENTYVSTDAITIRAGESANVNIKLYTEHNEMYNDDIDLNNDIRITGPQDDATFKASLSKQSQAYANYTLQITSTQATKSTTSFTISIRQYNTNTYIDVKVIALTVNIGNPHPEYTAIKINDVNVGEVREVDESTKIKLEFALYDIYKNKFEDKEILSYISIRNHGYVIIPELLNVENEYNYQALFLPKYPPVEMSINIYYNDGTFETNLLVHPIVLTIKTKVNWQSTQIISNNAYSLTAGEELDMQLKLFDKSGICVDKVDEGVTIKIEMKGPLENAPQDYAYTFIQHPALPDQVCSMYYELVIGEHDKPFYTKAGTYTLTLTACYDNGETYSIRKISQRVTPGEIDIDNFILDYNYKDAHGYDIPTNVIAGEYIPFIIRARDKYENEIQTPFSENFTVEFKDGNDNVLDKNNYTISQVEATPGNIEYLLTIYKKGQYDIYAKYNEEIAKIKVVKGPTSFFIIAGSCSSRHPKVNEEGIENIMTTIEASFDLICLDDYQNELSKGGEMDSFDININLNVSNSFTVIKHQLIDNEDGSYVCKFTPPLEGIYNIKVLLHNNEYFTKSIQVSGTNCKGETPILCPNTLKCVANILDCISDRGDCTEANKPFKCNVGDVTTCVNSQNECNCPENYIRCGYMNVCVPTSNQDMCQFSLPVNCKKYGSGLELCDDGICRKSKDLSPNQVVCPIGFVLCADLTCRTSYEQCHIYKDCDITEIRCNDMSCVSDQKLCPSNVHCNDPTKKVCPDGSCVDNEWECNISTCPEDFVRCSDNSCVTNIEDCPKNVACGHGLTLCSDFICREEC